MFRALLWFQTLCLIFLTSVISAQERTDDNIYLINGTISFDNFNGRSGKIAASAVDSLKIGKPILGIVGFKENPDESTRARLRAAGVFLEDYIPNRAWVAVISRVPDQRLLETFGFRGIINFGADLKADTNLLKGVLSRPPVVAGKAELWIRFPSYFAADSVEKWLIKDHGATIVSKKLLVGRILAIRTDIAHIRSLADSPYVDYLQEAPGPDEYKNGKSEVMSRANILQSQYGPYADGLLGRNVVIGVGDDADPLQHIDFSGRLINRFDKSGEAGHGLHTMGTVGGAGIRQEMYTGYAPKSQLVSQYYSNILAYGPTYYQDFSMRLTNNSYGQDVYSDNDFRRYNLYSAYLDQMGLDLPDLLHVFAAGNSGSVDFPENPYRLAVTGELGFGTVVSSYQTAKNVLTVGNIDSIYVRRSASSRGPVQDGRLKPEIVALGTGVRSTYLNNWYVGLTGTSMAAPAVTGGAALLTEQYQRQFPGKIALPLALMKALLCNGATDVGNIGPDYSYGYGAMNLLRSSEMLKNSRFVSGNITTNGQQNNDITIPPNTAQIKVMLCWNDPPAHPAAVAALINDLDLTLKIGSTTILPYVNNPNPGTVNVAATRNVDRLNNIEQVVFDNPPAGIVQISVQGYDVPAGNQEYYLVYDFIPAGTTLTAPAGGQKYRPGDKMLVSWETNGSATGYHLEYFDGTNWIRFASSLPPGTRQFFWTIPNNFSPAVTRIRIIRLSDNQINTSPSFSILQQPIASLAPDADQCEGMITITWPSVPNAEGYELMRLQNDEMKVVASVPSSQLQYSFSGMHKDSLYWVAVRPFAGNLAGLRSVALSRRPDNGQCAGSLSNGDLAITKLVSPAGSGRQLTSTALKSANEITVRIKNLDNIASAPTAATITYRINLGNLVTQNITVPALGVASETDVTFSTTADLSVPGSYQIEVTLTATGDQNTSNNTINTRISQLTNPKITLASTPSVMEHLDNFSGTPIQSFQLQYTGLNGADRYDFSSTTPGGRIRTFVNTGIARSDDRALTLDAESYPHESNTNYLTGTYNLSDFNVNTDEIRLDFWYLQHNQSAGAANKVWVRGKDTDSWIEVYDLLANQDSPGNYRRSSSIEITDLLRANSQSFSSSTQMRWGQTGSFQAATREDVNGYTFDDIRLSVAVNDVVLKSIVAPGFSNCALGAQEPVSVRVYNSMSYPVSNIAVSYQIDNGTIITENIATLGANAELDYTFAATANLSAFKSYTIKCRVIVSGDNVDFNDEMEQSFTNSPLITTFPYLQNFEADNGFWFAGGKLVSWEYGKPESTLINRAASGSKAWKTRLSGNYHDQEKSYLYSPCFQIGGMSNPTLSMMLAIDLEDCQDAARCDGVWIEFSYDGQQWQQLGNKNDGTNWYNRSYPDQAMWSVEKYTRWHVATLPLPGQGQQSIRLRFVMSADQFENREGIAIDDIHIYDNVFPIYSSGNSQVISNTINSGADSWTTFTDNGAVLASFNPKGNAAGTVQASTYHFSGAIRNIENTYYHNRNYVVNSAGITYNPAAGLRLYFTDAEMETLLAATGCPNCLNAKDVTDIGITRFSSTVPGEENGNISDNTNGTWSFLKPVDVIKIPYDNGYFVEFRSKSFSEFWLSPAALFDEPPMPVRLADFTVVLSEKTQSLLSWKATEMVNFSHFEVQRAIGNDNLRKGSFETIATLQPTDFGSGIYQYHDNLQEFAGAIFYRLRMINLDGTFEFSELRSVMLFSEARFTVFPNPSSDGLFFINHQFKGSVSFSVSDLQGRRIRSGNITGEGFQRKKLIDISTESAGIYMIDVNYRDRIESFKVIKK